ncbi:hypothetical protein Q1695_011234 [Nippostrongylus brasiliensis]|nr:hypothetical protein Q1695_011234 [Nippostrongylus brasiliensis]
MQVAGDTTVRDSSDELAVELQSREEKTYQTTDESKRDIKVALNIWKQSLEAENKRLCEVLPAVQQRYEVLVKQRNALVENVNTLRDAVGLPRYITEDEWDALDKDVKTAASFSLSSIDDTSSVSTCSSLPTSQIKPRST